MFEHVALAELSPCKTFLSVFLKVAHKFGRIENSPPPLKPEVPVCLWLELCTMVLLRRVTARSNHGRNDGEQGAQFSGRRVTMRAPKNPNNVTSTVLQCSTFASERPQVRAWGRQTCFLPRAPSDLVTPLAVSQYSSAFSMCLKWGVAQLHSYSRS